MVYVKKVLLAATAFSFLNFSTALAAEEIPDDQGSVNVDFSKSCLDSLRENFIGRTLDTDPRIAEEQQIETKNKSLLAPATVLSCRQFRNDYLVKDGKPYEVAKLFSSIRIEKASDETEADCHFKDHRVELMTSNISFDCGNSVFDGTQANGKLLGAGLRLGPKNLKTGVSADQNPKLAVISNVWVKNCNFVNYTGAGILLENKFNRTNPSDVEFYKKILIPMHESGQFDELNDPSSPAELLRQLSPRDIYIQNVQTYNTGLSGIYVHNHITNVNVNNVKLSYAKVGMYFDSGSRKNLIRNSCFMRIGYNPENLPEGLREGIAFDGAAANKVYSNLFFENFGGGVHMYKNCWESSNYQELYDKKMADYLAGKSQEKPDAPLAQFPRRQRAEQNIVEGNTIVGGSIGVAIGRRQWALMLREDATNPYWAYCGDKPAATAKKGSLTYDVIRDYANNNKIIKNKFINTSTGVFLSDHSNEIRDNTFIQNPLAIDGSSYKIEGKDFKRQKPFGAIIRVLSSLKYLKNDKLTWEKPLKLPDVSSGNIISGSKVVEYCNKSSIDQCTFLAQEKILRYPHDPEKDQDSRWPVSAVVMEKTLHFKRLVSDLKP